MALTIERQGGLLGARVHGVDFSQTLSDELLEEIAAALYAHQVISMPAAAMTPDQHVQIALHFGELELHATDQFAVDEEASHITVVDSEAGHRASSSVQRHLHWDDRVVVKVGTALVHLLLGFVRHSIDPQQKI